MKLKLIGAALPLLSGCTLIGSGVGAASGAAYPRYADSTDAPARAAMKRGDEVELVMDGGERLQGKVLTTNSGTVELETRSTSEWGCRFARCNLPVEHIRSTRHKVGNYAAEGLAAGLCIGLAMDLVLVVATAIALQGATFVGGR